MGFFFFFSSFWYVAVFPVSFFFSHTSQTHSFEALTYCKCSFSKRLQRISVRSRIAWILCIRDDSEVCQWGTRCTVSELSADTTGDFLQGDQARFELVTSCGHTVFISCGMFECIAATTFEVNHNDRLVAIQRETGKCRVPAIMLTLL